MKQIAFAELENNPRFLKKIEESRASVRTGHGIPWELVKQEDDERTKASSVPRKARGRASRIRDAKRFGSGRRISLAFLAKSDNNAHMTTTLQNVLQNVKESAMKTNRCVWKVMLALFIAAIIPLLIIGCSNKDENKSKSEHPTKNEGSSTEKPEHPAAESEHPE